MWRKIEDIGVDYGVDPVVFAVLYLLFHVVLFYGCLGMAAYGLRRRCGRSALAWAGGAGGSYFVPYVYVLASGRNFSTTTYLVIGSLAVLSALLLAVKLRTLAHKAEGAEPVRSRLEPPLRGRASYDRRSPPAEAESVRIG